MEYLRIDGISVSKIYAKMNFEPNWEHKPVSITGQSKSGLLTPASQERAEGAVAMSTDHSNHCWARVNSPLPGTPPYHIVC